MDGLMLVLRGVTKNNCYAYFTCSAGHSADAGRYLRDMALQEE